MNAIKFCFALICLCFVGFSCYAQTEYGNRPQTSALDTTSLTVSLKNPSVAEEVKIIRDENPIRIKRGESLTIKIENENHELIQVRVHSSLGRLVRNFQHVSSDVTLTTQNLQPGIYMIVIKRPGIRKIQKLFLMQ